MAGRSPRHSNGDNQPTPPTPEPSSDRTPRTEDPFIRSASRGRVSSILDAKTAAGDREQRCPGHTRRCAPIAALRLLPGWWPGSAPSRPRPGSGPDRPLVPPPTTFCLATHHTHRPTRLCRYRRCRSNGWVEVSDDGRRWASGQAIAASRRCSPRRGRVTRGRSPSCGGGCIRRCGVGWQWWHRGTSTMSSRRRGCRSPVVWTRLMAVRASSVAGCSPSPVAGRSTGSGAVAVSPRRQRLDGVDVADPSGSAASLVDAAAALAAALTLLGQLTPDQREVVALRVIVGMSVGRDRCGCRQDRGRRARRVPSGAADAGRAPRRRAAGR